MLTIDPLEAMCQNHSGRKAETVRLGKGPEKKKKSEFLLMVLCYSWVRHSL